MPTITVTGKGDLGYSPLFGEIRAGQVYSITEDQLADELFDRQINQEQAGDPADGGV